MFVLHPHSPGNYLCNPSYTCGCGHWRYPLLWPRAPEARAHDFPGLSSGYTPHIITINSVNIAKYLRKFYNRIWPIQRREERKAAMLATVASTGEKLKRFRRGEGLTQAELAAASGVAQSTIAQIETESRKDPHPRTLKRLAEALDLQARDLLPDAD